MSLFGGFGRSSAKESKGEESPYSFANMTQGLPSSRDREAADVDVGAAADDGAAVNAAGVSTRRDGAAPGRSRRELYRVRPMACRQARRSRSVLRSAAGMDG